LKQDEIEIDEDPNSSLKNTSKKAFYRDLKAVIE